jgi:hypothetical protein
MIDYVLTEAVLNECRYYTKFINNRLDPNFSIPGEASVSRWARFFGSIVVDDVRFTVRLSPVNLCSEVLTDPYYRKRYQPHRHTIADLLQQETAVERAEDSVCWFGICKGELPYGERWGCAIRLGPELKFINMALVIKDEVSGETIDRSCQLHYKYPAWFYYSNWEKEYKGKTKKQKK